jgi:hypothetical protein
MATESIPALLRRSWQSRQRRQRWQAVRAAQPLTANECGLMACQGIGDHLLVFAFAPAIARQHGWRVRAVTGTPRFRFLRDLFPDPPEFLDWQADPADALLEPTLAGGRWFYAHFPQFELMRAVGYRDFHFLDAYRCRFGLSSDAQAQWPEPPKPEQVAAAAKALEALGLPPGRTVVLGVDARSTPTSGLDQKFWSALAGRLQARGLTPLVNLGPQTPPLPGVASQAIALADFRATVVAAGQVCTTRSGLSDLSCDLPCQRAVLYPDVPYWGGSLRQGTSFAAYGLPHPPLEITAAPERTEETIGTLVRHFAA